MHVWANAGVLKHSITTETNKAQTTRGASRDLAEGPLLAPLAYRQVVLQNDQVCAVQELLFTTAMLLGMDAIGYSTRYCDEHASGAEATLAQWDGTGHPGGAWIKGNGAGMELLPPARLLSATALRDRIRPAATSPVRSHVP